MSTAALIVAAGRGVRFGADVPKQFLPLGGKPILFHSIEIFENMAEVDRIWLVLPGDFLEGFELLHNLSEYGKIAGLVSGGERRQDSVMAGLTQLPAGTEIVAIHDAVRPFASAEAVAEAIRRARRSGAALLATPLVDTLKRCDTAGRIVETVDREQLWLAQTPQVFRVELIRRAYERVFSDGVEVTDEAAAVERLGEPVEVVSSDTPNLKITTEQDLRHAEWYLRERQRP